MGTIAVAVSSLAENHMMKRGIRIEKPSHLEAKPSELPAKADARLSSFFVGLLVLSYLLSIATLILFFLIKQ